MKVIERKGKVKGGRQEGKNIRERKMKRLR